MKIGEGKSETAVTREGFTTLQDPVQFYSSIMCNVIEVLLANLITQGLQRADFLPPFGEQRCHSSQEALMNTMKLKHYEFCHSCRDAKVLCCVGNHKTEWEMKIEQGEY